MKRLKTFTITDGAITVDTDWLALDGSPTAAELLIVRTGAKGIELMALVTNPSGKPAAAAGDFDYDIIEQMQEGVAQPGTLQTRLSLVATAAGLNVGTQADHGLEGARRPERKVAIRISAVSGLVGNGILEIWAREV